jgi:sulfide:quinone oxidoreductase
VFAETAARAVADDIAPSCTALDGCSLMTARVVLIEFGGGLVGKVDADFLSGPSPRAPFLGLSRALADENLFATTRRRRWFGG